jgi:TolB-like protein/DNA-binding winged helix-turn-helix (wHTH) protein
VPTNEELEKGFNIGEWEVIPSRRVLRCGDEEIQPEPKVFGVLMSLALRDGDGVTRDQLAEEVWKRPVGDEPINRCINQLRGHFGDRKPYRYIKALTGSGYLLMEPVVLKEPTPTIVPDPKPVKRSSIVFRGLVVLALIVMAAFVILWKPPAPPDVRSIGVLPFKNVSGLAENQYLVEGFKQELIKTLQPIPDVVIKTGREEYGTRSNSELAEILDVDSVLLGAVTRNGDSLKVSYELVVGSDNTAMFGGSVTGRVADLFDLQEEVAEQIRNDLFGKSEQVLISASRPSNFDAYDHYMQGLYAFDRRGNGRNLEDAMALFEETIQLDPSFGPAYLQLATAHALLPAHRGAPLNDSNRTAVSIVERGIVADRSIEDASGAIYGFIYHSQKEWAKAELAYEQATNATVVDSNAFSWYSRMLASVGRLDAALEQALKAYELDPDSAIVASRVALSYAWIGDAENATRYFEVAKRFGAEGSTHLMGWALFLSREGDIEKSGEIAKIAAGHAGISPDWIDVVLAGILDPELSEAALQAVNDTVGTGNMPAQIEVVARTTLGDIDGAMQVASLLTNPGEAFEMDLLWIPEFAPLREHPDFMDLMEQLGVAEYWRLHGCKFEDTLVSCMDD